MPSTVGNNQIYRLVGELVRIRNEELGKRLSTDSFSDAELKGLLKQELNQGRFTKDVAELGGVGSASFNEFLDGFVGALPKRTVPVSTSPFSSSFTTAAAPTRVHHYETIKVRCHRCYHSCCSCSHSTDSFWFWMYLFNSGGKSSSSKSDSKSESIGDVILGLIAFVAVLMIIASAVIAAIYLFGELADIIERMIHKEGYSYAMFSLSLLGMSAAGSFLGATTIMPLIFLAIGVNNPVGWSIFGIISLGTVFTAISHALLFQLPVMASEKSFQETLGSDGFVGKDFGRVQITEAELKHLEEEEGLDPMKVRIAIALLRHEMGAGPVPSKYGNHALFSQACRTSAQQKTLETIRALRSGNLDDQDFASGVIEIGKMRVDMRLKPSSGDRPGNGHSGGKDDKGQGLGNSLSL